MLQKPPRIKQERFIPKHLILRRVKNGTFLSQRVKWTRALFNIINRPSKMAIQPHSGEDFSHYNQSVNHTVRFGENFVRGPFLFVGSFRLKSLRLNRHPNKTEILWSISYVSQDFSRALWVKLWLGLLKVFSILSKEYVRSCESVSNLIATILGYSESIGTFITCQSGTEA